MLLTLTIRNLVRYFKPAYSTKKGAMSIKFGAIFARFYFFEILIMLDGIFEKRSARFVTLC